MIKWSIGKDAQFISDFYAEFEILVTFDIAVVFSGIFRYSSPIEQAAKIAAVFIVTDVYADLSS